MTVQIITADCRTALAAMLPSSVHCCVTSPPYFGLRDYGVAGQIGLEETLEAYIAEMVAVFREVRRVLREDGTLWLNLGDSYAGLNGGYSGADRPSNASSKSSRSKGVVISGQRPKGISDGLKPKDLMMVPARVALALQADGWWLRKDIIWHKPNPMPESCTDRPTSSHEHVFLMAKSERYFYDADAIREAENVPDWDDGSRVFGGVNKHGANAKQQRTTGRLVTARKVKVPGGWDQGEGAHGTIHRDGRTSAEYQEAEVKPGRNKRDVWTIATQPFPEAHFATFPPALVKPCILAGCPKGGTVLDPFGGAGTTGLVADRLNRSAILIELNPEYADIARRRIHGDAPLFGAVA
jgi:DNA modification methylase